jgi:hypothetical protein
VTRRPWALVLAVLALGLPSVVFVLSHLVLERLKLPLAESLDLVLAWTLTFTGMLGVFTTAGAVLVTIAGSFLAGVSGKTKVLMWAFATASLLALVYLAQVRP